MQPLLYGIYEATMDGSGRLTISTEALPGVTVEDGAVNFYTTIGPNGKIWLFPAACLDESTASKLATRQRELSPPDLPAIIQAVRDVIDPFNLLTITANAAFTVGIDSRTAYGPGMKGFGRDVGYSFVQDATGEFIGTYAVCSILHQDPRYHREPHASTMRRVGHALKHTVISQHDDGTPMLNYENFITYPASAELSNLYVPGVHGNGPSTVVRIVTGLATDPVNNLITEFLPDFARRFHVRIVFVQQILNQIATNGTF